MKRNISRDIEQSPLHTHSARVVVDTSPPTDRMPVVLKKAEWAKIGEGDNLSFEPVPESWFHSDELLDWMLCLVACPNCKIPSILMKKVSKVDAVGKVTPSFQCKHCGFHRYLMLDKFHGWTLYAMAIERPLTKGTSPATGDVAAEIIFTKATNEVEARKELGADLGHVRIIAIGPAIGFRVEKNPSTSGGLVLRG